MVIGHQQFTNAQQSARMEVTPLMRAHDIEEGGKRGGAGLMITYVIIIWMIIHTRVVQRLSIHKWEGTRINVVFICPRIAHLLRVINFRHALGTNTLQAHCRDAERSERLHRE